MQGLCGRDRAGPAVVRALALGFMALAVSCLPAPLAAGSLPHVRQIVLLSLDGARSDAIKTVLPPTLAARAAVARAAKTISPSLTLPSHASMLSGVAPWRHRVTFNDWHDGEPYFTRTTVFTEVTRSGGHAAAIVHKRKLLMFLPRGQATSVRLIDHSVTANRPTLEWLVRAISLVLYVRPISRLCTTGATDTIDNTMCTVRTGR